MKKSVNKEEKENNNMVWQLAIGLLLIVFLVVVFIPTVDVLVLNVNLPPTESTVYIIPTKVTIQQYVFNYMRIGNITDGNFEVFIVLENESRKELFTLQYNLKSPNTWIINTFRPISSGNIVTIEIPNNEFKKVIPVG